MTALEAIKKFAFNVTLGAHLPQNFDIQATHGDTIELTHNFYDRQGNALSVTGATATLRVARKNGTGQVVEKTDAAGIVVSGTKTVSTFTADDIGGSGAYTYQLRLTVSGNSLAAVQGDIDLAGLIE